MSANPSRPGAKGCRRWRAGLAALALACGGMALAQQVVTVPAAHLNHAEGSVAYAPQGEREWQDVQPRRLLKRGDRLWTDRGSRAEVQAGGHALRINGETQLILENVGDTATQLSVTQGSVIATVTRMNPGDSFEVGTPNLAFRARQPGDYRIDVDVKQGVTRVVVAGGSGVVYGEKGEALELRSGQRLTFRDRNLTRLLQPAFAAVDDFDRWAGARKRGEPTVSMPMVAAAPASAPVAPPDMGRSRTIVISGTAASLKQPAPNAPAKAAPAPAVAKSAPPVAPAFAQQVSIAAAKPLAAAKVTLPAVPPAAAVTPAILPPPRAQAVANPQQAPAPAPNAQAQAQAQAAAIAQAQAAAQAKAARVQQDRRVAEAKRAEDRRRAVAARRADDERRRAQARREQEHKRQVAKRAEEERRIAQARRAAEERRLAAARKAEAQRLAESRRQQLARLQEQARREEQSVQAKRAEAARRADDERREEQVRREEQARREEERRQRMLAEQARRDQQRREEEVWLRQQQPQLIQQPARPQPMGVPARRVS